MKKIYSLLILALMTVLSAAAEDVKVTVVIDNADAVNVTLDGRDPLEYTTGSNVYEFNKYSGICITPKDGYGIAKIVNQAGTPVTDSYGVYWIQGYYLPDNDQVYTVTTIDLSEAEKASFVVNVVGDPSLVSVSFNNSRRTVTLAEGENTLEYVVGYETIFYVAKNGYDKPLYSVTVNGVSRGSEYNYEIALEEGLEIEIETSFPDVPCTYNISYTGIEDVITSVRVNYTTVSDFDGRTFTCQAGDGVSLSTSTDYLIEKVTLDGEEITGSYGSYSFTAVSDGEIVVSARPYGDLNFVVNINDPAGLTLYAGYSYQDQQYTLVEGRNELTLSERNTYISFDVDKSAGYYVESITDKDGNQLSTTSTTIYDVTEGAEYTFTLAKYVLDNTAVVWVNDASLATYLSMYNSERISYTLATGYNVIDFAAGYNPFNFGFYAKGDSYVLINGEECEPMYSGSTTYEAELADGDVIKIFIAAAPVESEVVFIYDDGVDAAVKRDIIVPVADPQAGLTCFDGTQIDIAPVEGDDTLEGVKVNDVVVPQNEDGTYTVTVNGTTEIRLLGGSAGIESVEADNAGNADVYNLQGIKVATREQLRTLPAGLYIVGGEKVLVK